MCILLTGAGMERARPRKTVTVRMAKFDRFLQLSATLEKHLFDKSRHGPKTAEIDQGSEGQRVGGHFTHHCWTVRPAIETGLNSAEISRS